MATTEIEREREKENEKQQEQSRMWETCGQWVALVLRAVATFIENAASISILITRLLAFVGLEPLLCHASSIPRHYDHLLPPRSSHDMDKLTVVLDLDETLVCAYESSSLPSFIHNQATQAGIKWFELQCVSVDKEDEGKQKVNHVTVYERPGLQEFLSEASEFAELVLFTAGLEGYARPLVDKIDSENRIAARLYRPATVTTKYRDHVKDLSCLARDLRRTVIIDNNPFSFLLQPMNGIPCVPFTGAHTDDQQLLQVLLPLLKHLAVQKDVRPVLYERFHMPAWFQKRGFPASDRVLDKKRSTYLWGVTNYNRHLPYCSSDHGSISSKLAQDTSM